MLYHKFGKSLPFWERNQQSLVAYPLLDYDNRNRELFHYQDYSVTQGKDPKALYGELVSKHHSHYRSLHHTFGKYNYPVLDTLSQKPYIQVKQSLVAFVGINPLSNWDASRLSSNFDFAVVLSPEQVPSPVSFVLLHQVVVSLLIWKLFSPSSALIVSFLGISYCRELIALSFLSPQVSWLHSYVGLSTAHDKNWSKTFALDHYRVDHTAHKCHSKFLPYLNYSTLARRVQVLDG